MPEYQNEYGDLGGVANLGHTMNNIALGLAQQKAMQMRFQQQMAYRMAEQALKQRLYQQEGQNYEAQAALHRAQTTLENTRNTDLTNAAAARNKLGSYAEDIPLIKYQQDLGIDTEGDLPNAISGMMGQIARLPGSATTGYPEKMMQLLQIGNAPMEQAIATRTKSQIPVSSQGGIFNAATGAIENMMPQHLGARQGLYDPTSGEQIGFNPAFGRQGTAAPNLVGSFANAVGKFSPLGDAPSPEDPTYNAWKTAIEGFEYYSKKAIAESKKAEEGISTPHGAPPSYLGPPNPATNTMPTPFNNDVKFESEDAARKFGRKSGDVITLLNPQTGQYQKARLK